MDEKINIKVTIDDKLFNIDEVRKDEGVIIPYSDQEYDQIKKDICGFVAYRTHEGKLIKDPETIRGLPYSIDDQTWKNKAYSLELIRGAIKEHYNNESLQILVVGASNGWLANCLAEDGHDVLGTGILYYEYDGLQTIKHYHTDFKLMLLHSHEIDRIHARFDLVLFENNLPYIKSVFSTLEKTKSLLKNDGLITCVGINVPQDIPKTDERIRELIQFFQEEWDHNINPYKTKMYFSKEDLERLKTVGFSIRARKDLKNRIKKLISRKVVIFDATYHNS